MKKIIALILTIGLLLSCLPFTTIAANAAVVVAENDTTTQGSYAYVYLRADNFVNVGALDIEIYYDSSAMSIHYTSNGTLFNSASVSTNTNTSGLIKISAMAVNGLTSGTSNYSNRMMTICFKINPDCPVGDYPIVVTVGDAYDNDFNPATISGVNGVVTVEKGSPKNFPFYTSLSATSVENGDEFTVQAYHSSSSSYKFASADFNIEYDRDLLKIKSIELDPALLIEGAVHSINTSNPGFAKISYASTNAISCRNLFKVTFEVIANVDAQTSVQIIASDVYDDELTSYSPATATATVSLKEKAVVPDYPDFKLESEKFIVGKPSDISVILEGNSKVAAADFVIDYDKDVFSINSVTANSEALSSGALIVINNNFNDGQIRFSYIMQNGDFAEDTNLITISATPLISPDEHYIMTSSGIDVCDINFNDITLDYIDDSDCIFLPTVIEPTCTEDGYTSYDCSCGEAYTAEPTPSLGGHNYGDVVIDIEPTCTEEGSKSRHCSVCDDKTDITVIEANGHSYSDWIIDTDPTCTEEGSKYKECSVCGDVVSEVIAENGHSYSTEWTIDIEPTCTEEGSKSRHCSVCGDKTDITVIEANGHSYGDWILTKAPGCIESGSAYKTCSTCGDIQEALSDLLLDSATYPESEHNYSDNINKTYNFSYPDAVALKLTFSSSTETESNYDFIYIYDAKGILQGKYSGTELSGETITLEGNSFSIKFTSDGSATRYGFSFDSIAAVIEDDVIKPLGHNYSDEWTIDIEPTCTEEGSKSRHCSVCDDKTDITAIEATGHSYGDWVVDIEPTCTEPGTATKACSECGDTQFAFFEKLLDSATYPESEHNYSDNINEIYNFSYPDAVALSITFSASTMIENNYDYIYIYDAKGNLQGKYTGTELAGETIIFEGNSFSINLTSDGSRTYYGFSFDSIVAFGEGLEIIKPKGHSYGDWIIDTDPTCTEEGTKYKEWSVSGEVVSEAIAENGHSYSTEWTIDIEPTCTEEGSKSHHCTVCGDKTDITAIELIDHNYEATDVMAAHPHTITYTCSECGAEKTEDSVDSSCIECMHIVGSENTRIDYENHLIFTSVQTCTDITEIIGVSETAKAIPTASHIFGNYEFLGTGTIISVYDNDVHIGDYTLIVSGDVNGDSVCDVLDCAQVALVANGHKTLDYYYEWAADVCYDEVIDINDYQEIVNITLAS